MSLGGWSRGAAEPSFADHRRRVPDAPPPENLEDWETLRAKALDLPSAFRESPVEVRLGDAYDFSDAKKKYEPRQVNWMRVRGALPDDPIVHTAMLVYLTDRTLLSTAARAHGLPWGKRRSASLDHAVWIHHPFVRGTHMLDQEWMLYASESPVAHSARGLIFGGIFQRDGTRIASVAQEALIRHRRT